VTFPRSCQINGSNSSCDLYNCSDEKRECVKIELPCFNFLGAVVGGLAAGIIAGIIVAVIIGLGLTAGGAYAVTQAVVAEGATSVVVNPLYQAAHKEQINPLHRQ